MSAITTSIRHCTTRLARVFRQEKYKEIKFERKNKTVFYRWHNFVKEIPKKSIINRANEFCMLKAYKIDI